MHDAGALAVIFTHHDQHPAAHAGRCEVGQRIGRHVGADDGLPGHGAAQRVVDGGAQHRGGRGLVGAGLHVHAETLHFVLGLDQHVEQMPHRRALIAADIGDAGLQQRLGDGDDALAVKRIAVAELQLLDFAFEGDFGHGSPGAGSRAAN